MSETRETAEPRRTRPGIYLLPNLFTTGALFAGFYGIVAAMNGRFVAAAVAITVAGLLDGLDGRIARLTNTQSDFGVQYDSLSDLVSFGLAPALIVYVWSLSSLAQYGVAMRKIGWLAAFLFAACAALRLARFNTQAALTDKRYFQGLASPAAAGVLVFPIWALEAEGISGHSVSVAALVITVVTALLMVSNVRYFSFKAWPDRIPFLWMLALVVLFVLLAIDLPKVLMTIAFVYAASGPVVTILGRRRSQRFRLLRKKARSKSADSPD
ncbi:MAG: CDP-diacylglycerol--serine O-phosphatidyltransferase [Xanthomonadales bacterium]|nr:CDP-diacylglycerol--serine O-phosphatidyltransferase [Xanthomonadales bacterium]